MKTQTKGKNKPQRQDSGVQSENGDHAELPPIPSHENAAVGQADTSSGEQQDLSDEDSPAAQKRSKNRPKKGKAKRGKKPELLPCCHVTFAKMSDGSITALPGQGCSQEDLEAIAMAAVDFAVGEDDDDSEELDDEDDEAEEE